MSNLRQSNSVNAGVGSSWRIVTGALLQESNSFSPVPTDLAYFETGIFRTGPESLRRAAGTGSELGGFIDEAEAWGVSLIPTVHACAATGGPILPTDRDVLFASYFARLEAALRGGPVDGVLLSLHGSWVAADDEDLDGRLLEETRRRVGPSAVVVCTLDLHANITSRMAINADALVGYASYPHLDMRETGVRGARLLFGALSGGPRPRTVFRKLPLVVPPENSQTTGGPVAVAKAAEAEVGKLPGVLSTSLFTVQPWLDVSDLGCSCVVVLDRSATAVELAGASDGMTRVLQALWDVRDEVRVDLVDPGVAVREAIRGNSASVITNSRNASGTGPVLLVDSADSPSAGACGDSSTLLRAIIEASPSRETRILLTLVDPQAARIGQSQNGSRVTVDLGGSFDHRLFEKVRFGGIARHVEDTTVRFGAGVGDGLTAELGDVTVIEGDDGPDSAPGLSVMVMSRPVACYDPEIYRVAGLSPENASVVVVKSATNFRWTYGPIARGWIYVDTPGAATPNLKSLPFTRISRPLSPWDEISAPLPSDHEAFGDPHKRAYARAIGSLPGGVTAGARANASLGFPFYVSRASGSTVFDIGHRPYIDLVTSNGAALVGHGHPRINEAVTQALNEGMACAYDGPAQIELAERLCDSIPSFERVRFTTSGTEATFYAIRLARAATGRTRIIKFEGHFHGYNNPLAFSMWPSPDPAISGPLGSPRAMPETSGLPPSSFAEVTVVPFNEPEILLKTLDVIGHETAAVILEPINYDAGCVVPDPGYLELVRRETEKRGIVLIFDEILSGFRTGVSGAQGYFGVTPDLSTVGKALGGGVPLSAFGGRADLMSVLSPTGPAIHTGTYNAHLIPVRAGIAFLDVISGPDFYPEVLRLSNILHTELRKAFTAAGLPVRVQGLGARFAMYFGLEPDVEVTRYRHAASYDRILHRAWAKEMVKRGVYTTPVWHHGISAAHSEGDILEIASRAFDSARAVVGSKVAQSN